MTTHTSFLYKVCTFAFYFEIYFNLLHRNLILDIVCYLRQIILNGQSIKSSKRKVHHFTLVCELEVKRQRFNYQSSFQIV